MISSCLKLFLYTKEVELPCFCLPSLSVDVWQKLSRLLFSTHSGLLELCSIMAWTVISSCHAWNYGSSGEPSYNFPITSQTLLYTMTLRYIFAKQCFATVCMSEYTRCIAEFNHLNDCCLLWPIFSYSTANVHETRSNDVYSWKRKGGCRNRFSTAMEVSGSFCYGTGPLTDGHRGSKKPVECTTVTSMAPAGRLWHLFPCILIATGCVFTTTTVHAAYWWRSVWWESRNKLNQFDELKHAFYCHSFVQDLQDTQKGHNILCFFFLSLEILRTTNYNKTK